MTSRAACFLALLLLGACSGQGGGLSATHAIRVHLLPGQAAECEEP